MTYLERLYALQSALLDAALGGPAITGYASYGLDAESWSALPVWDVLEKVRNLILLEENRVSGRRDLRIVRGYRGYAQWR